MKILKLLASVLVLSFCNSSLALAQNVTVNPGAGSYPTLKAAFDAVNAGTHTGAVTLSVIADTTETAPAILNASGSGAASYTSIVINPVGVRTISGAITAGSPLIDFNGADNVTIDGLNALGNSLTIANTTVAATSITSTIRFIGGATGNTITNSNIQGSGTMSVATNGAVIFFSTDAVTANGNDNNTISNNNIGPAGANLPTKGILGNGSTSTTAIGNSGIVITNNNIFDYFGAAVTSSGVATNGGCNTWTITNNRFYQTAPRTWTTGANHRAIDINPSTATSGAQGFTITGNIVGYASNTQAGVYALTGSTGKFQGIVYNGITAGALTTISNNTVAAVSLTGVTSSGTSTSSPFVAIMPLNGLVTTNSNTIGSQSATGSLVFSTNTTTATDVIGIYNFTLDNWIANDNNIGGFTMANAGASGAFIFYGMRANTGTTLTSTAQNNLIGGVVANSIQSSSTSTTAQLMGLVSNNAIALWRNNTIRNMTAAGGTGTSTGASVIGIASATSTPNQTIEQNTISALANTNAAAATTVAGIQFSGGTVNLLQRNLIHSLNNASATGIINGINISGGTNTLRNNMIRLGQDAAGADITTGVAISGINEFLGTNNVFNNSVLINGSGVSGTANTFAFNGQQTVNTRSFQNNNFTNARGNGGGTGKHYAIRVGGSAPNPAGLTSNYNNLFVSGTGGILGLFNAIDQNSLALWQAATGQDAQSISANPAYVSATDLHETAGSPTRDVGLVIASVTNDFDGDSRPGTNVLYDIGADEFDGIAPVGNDIQATAFIDPANGGSKLVSTSFSPQASFTNNGVNGQTNVTVRYRILNAALAEVYNQTALIPSIGTGVTTTVTFPSTSIATAGAYSLFAKAELATDTVPGNDQISGAFTIEVPLAGTYTVGSGGNYPSLTNGGGAFQALNNLGASGNVTLNIISDLSGETGANALNQLAPGIGVRIQPFGATRTVTGSSAAALIALNGADNVTIDGSLTGATAGDVVGGDAALRNLSFVNTNTGTSAGVILVSTGAAGAQNVTLRNLGVSGQDPLTTLIGISVGGATLGTTGADNDGLRIENCSVQKSIFGIYAAGTSAANPNLTNVITKNDVSATGANRVRRVGILVFNQDGVDVSLNQVGGMDTNESADAVGIGIGTQAIDSTTVLSGGVVNATVSRNRVNGVVSTSATGFSAVGIAVGGGTPGPNTLSNNMVSGVSAPSTSPDLVAGIYVIGVPSSVTRLYANSVSLTGDRGVVAAQMPGFALAITGADPTVELKNNVFATTQIASGGGVDAKAYAIGMTSTTFANLDANYNLYYSAGANAGFFRSGSLGVAAGTSYATLALWQAAIADDANSLFGDPLYVSASDLHIPPASPASNAGTPLAAVTVDIDGNTRGNPPEMGADEIFVNTAPTITAVGVTRRAGDAGAASTIANVTDTEDALNTLSVTVNAGATATVNSVTVNSISTSVAGVVSANVVAACGATSASFTLRVTDSGTLFNESTLNVTVDPNLPPTLSYGPLNNALFGQNLSVNPDSGPNDSGSVSSVAVQSTGTYTGGASVDTAGVVSFTSAAPVGSHTIVIRATDNCTATTDANLALTVGQASTTTTITADTPDPSVVNTPVSVSYTVVANAPGAGTPTGTVTVSDGVNNCSATVAAGQCSLSLATQGARTLTATYAGDSNFTGSNDTEAHQVDPPANTAPTIAVVGVTRRAGDAAATATIANVTDAEDALNTLAVTVNGGAAATLNGVTVNGIATAVTGAVSANVGAACGATSASFTLRVTDSGTLFNESTLNVTVDPNLPPTLTYAALTNAVFGQNLSVNPATGPTDSGSVSGVAVQGAGTYTGGVTVDNAGVVSLTSAAPVGSHTIVIRATDNCAATTDANLVLSVGQAATTTAITADTPDPTIAGENFTVSYTVVANSPGAGTPAGNVTVSDGVDNCTASVAAGQCSLALGTPGARTLTATYAGDASFAGSSGTAAHTVSPTANLAISKTVQDALIGTGVIQYTITVSNAGPSAVTGASVVDNFPAEVTGVAWTCSGTVGGTCTANGTGNISQLANLPVGATVVYSITGNVALPLPTSISNTATVTAPGGTTDPALANNTSTAVTVILFFRDGFEGGPVAPTAEKLLIDPAGAYSSLMLPIADLAGLAVNAEPVEVIRFALQDSLVVVQTRRMGMAVEARVLQVNADRSWTVSSWTALDQASALHFDWAGGQSLYPISRLRVEQ